MKWLLYFLKGTWLGHPVAFDPCPRADGDMARRANLRSSLPMERERHGSASFYAIISGLVASLLAVPTGEICLGIQPATERS